MDSTEISKLSVEEKKRLLKELQPSYDSVLKLRESLSEEQVPDPTEEELSILKDPKLVELLVAETEKSSSAKPKRKKRFSAVLREFMLLTM